MPHRVRCSPLGTREVEADVVDRIPAANTATIWDYLVVEHNGHRYRVDERDVEPV